MESIRLTVRIHSSNESTPRLIIGNIVSDRIAIDLILEKSHHDSDRYPMIYLIYVYKVQIS